MTAGYGFMPGQHLPGTRYRIVRVVGEGGMGVAYECVKEPSIRCVVKVMRSHLSADPDQRRRFLGEVRILAELDHPNIVRVFDYDVLEDETPFFAMELLTGRTLRHVLEERRTLGPRLALKIVRQLLAALECAHTHEPPLVHRDVKPDNIFLHAPKNDESVVKLLDFGVATVAARATSMAGTWGYMSPEQLLNEPLTAQTDVYASAVVLFEMLTGSPPFSTSNLDELCQATLRTPAPRLRSLLPWVPKAVDDAVAAALEKQPSLRPTSALELARALEALDGVEIDDGRTLPTPSPMQPATSQRTSASLTALAKGPTPNASPAPVHHVTRDPAISFSSGSSDKLQARRRSVLIVGAGMAIGLLGAGGVIAFSSRVSAPTAVAAPTQSASSTLPLASAENLASAAAEPAVSHAVPAAPAASVVPTNDGGVRPHSSPTRPAAPSSTGSARAPRFEPSIGD